VDDFSYSVAQWTVLFFASFFVGLSKTGIPGVGIFAIGLFATVIPARASAGVVLPLLIAADMVAVVTYWRDARWAQLLRLFPWAIFGIIVGWLAMDHINDKQTARLIGLILTIMVTLQMLRGWQRRRKNAPQADPDAESVHGHTYTASMGALAGFTTMVANAAGPIMNLYLVAMRMPKMAFMGTAAWYFFLLNSFKVPFSINLGLINWPSFVLNLKLIPPVLIGAIFGRLLLPYINQRLFEFIALGFALVAGIRLLFF
jgi:uncharacterized membrane protein YfcA